MSEQPLGACWGKTLAYGLVGFLCLLSASGSLQAHLFLPAWLWVAGGTVIALGWAHERTCRFEGTDRKTHDCSACGIFGHKLPWVLLTGAGLGNLTDLSSRWAAAGAYGVAVALFSLSGSFFMMRISEEEK